MKILNAQENRYPFFEAAAKAMTELAEKVATNTATDEDFDGVLEWLDAFKANDWSGQFKEFYEWWHARKSSEGVQS